MRKRAGFARALVMEPDVVIFDEPDSGLDPVRTALLCELIQEMHELYGGTYIVVTHNIAFPLRQHTEKGEDEIEEIVSRRMREVGLGGEGTKMPNELSGGMRKRAGFARALVLDPEIVLFDEPDSGLDPVRTALLCELIKEVHAENGGCYVVITHDIMSARRVAEHISVLWKGRIVESGPAEELFASENPFVRQFLSGEAAGPLGME
jgi:phospholipid/cholesterol/gamma-HCH transport system ATP-binding protein